MVVELSFVRVADVSDAALDAARARLTDAEQAHVAGCLFERDRREFLVTRAAAAAVLGPLVEGRLTFVRSEAGKPELDPPSELRFNLTNTAELVCCAVTKGRPVGVDAEPVSRGAHILALAPTVFTSDERRALAGLDDPARRRRAVALWTLKEAYMKARGVGLALAPEDVDLAFTAAGAAHLASVAPSDAPIARWSFATTELDGHLVSVCVEGALGEVSARRLVLRP